MGCDASYRVEVMENGSWVNTGKVELLNRDYDSFSLLSPAVNRARRGGTFKPIVSEDREYNQDPDDWSGGWAVAITLEEIRKYPHWDQQIGKYQTLKDRCSEIYDLPNKWVHLGLAEHVRLVFEFNE